MGCIEVCLEKKEARFWGGVNEAGAACLPSRSKEVKLWRRGVTW